MIRYRYDMTVDPEPPGVTRLAYAGHWKPSNQYWAVWHRLPCRRIHALPGKHVIRESRKCKLSHYGTHYHWDTKPADKLRSWGSFRGSTKVINIEAFSRMHRQYRAKTKGKR